MRSSIDLALVVSTLEYEIKKAGSLRSYARMIDVSPAYLSDVRHYRRGPGESVLTPLGFTKVITRVVTYYSK